MWSGKSVNVVKHVWGDRGAQVRTWMALLCAPPCSNVSSHPTHPNCTLLQRLIPSHSSHLQVCAAAAALPQSVMNIGRVSLLRKHPLSVHNRAALQPRTAHPPNVHNRFQLTSFKWALKLSVESNTAKNLGRAFIAVELKVVDGADCVHTKAFELSLFQFQSWCVVSRSRPFVQLHRLSAVTFRTLDRF